MMKMSLYIQSNGILSRKDSTVQFHNEDVKKALPIAQIRDIHAFGKVSIRSGVIGLLSEKQIPVHFYNAFGRHISSLIPKEDLISGKVLVAQVKSHLDPVARAEIAASIVDATRKNMLTILSKHMQKDDTIRLAADRLRDIHIPVTNVQQIMAAEANIWKTYYTCFTPIAPSLPFDRRSFRPPLNEMNSLISLLNTLLYTSTLSMISQTYLNPTVSFLHDPMNRRYSLALDLAEYFKPLVVHRLIFRLVNRKQIKSSSFTKQDGIKLKKKYFTNVLNAFQEELNSLVKGKKKVSYRSQIKFDAHKLVKTVLGEKNFRPYTE